MHQTITSAKNIFPLAQGHVDVYVHACMCAYGPLCMHVCPPGGGDKRKGPSRDCSIRRERARARKFRPCKTSRGAQRQAYNDLHSQSPPYTHTHTGRGGGAPRSKRLAKFAKTVQNSCQNEGRTQCPSHAKSCRAYGLRPKACGQQCKARHYCSQSHSIARTVCICHTPSTPMPMLREVGEYSSWWGASRLQNTPAAVKEIDSTFGGACVFGAGHLATHACA